MNFIQDNGLFVEYNIDEFFMKYGSNRVIAPLCIRCMSQRIKYVLIWSNFNHFNGGQYVISY